MDSENEPPTTSQDHGSRFEMFVDPVDGSQWRIDMAFIDSNWTCLWGNGCEGIRHHLAADMNEGCCSVGAHMIDDEEAMLISALGLTLSPERFQRYDEAASGGILADGAQLATRVVDDACIFFNKPGFAGGTGCALHLAAVDEGEPPMDWKPSICWQAPLKVDRQADGTRTLRPWGRADWNDNQGASDEGLAWCCTERNRSEDAGPSAYIGDRPVSETLHAELRGIVGPEVAVQLQTRADQNRDGDVAGG